MVGPPALPAAIVDKLNQAINQASTQPDMVTRLQNAHIQPLASGPRDFRAFVEKEIAKWRKFGETVKIEF